MTATTPQADNLEAAVERLTAYGVGVGESAIYYGSNRQDGTSLRQDVQTVLSTLSSSNARAVAAEELVRIGEQIVGDYQSSAEHHPRHILIRLDHFEALSTTLASMKGA